MKEEASTVLADRRLGREQQHSNGLLETRTIQQYSRKLEGEHDEEKRQDKAGKK